MNDKRTKLGHTHASGVHTSFCGAHMLFPGTHMLLSRAAPAYDPVQRTCAFSGHGPTCDTDTLSIVAVPSGSGVSGQIGLTVDVPLGCQSVIRLPISTMMSTSATGHY